MDPLNKKVIYLGDFRSKFSELRKTIDDLSLLTYTLETEIVRRLSDLSFQLTEINEHIKNGKI